MPTRDQVVTDVVLPVHKVGNRDYMTAVDR